MRASAFLLPLLLALFLPQPAARAEDGGEGARPGPKSYETPFEQTGEVAQQNTVWLRGIVQEAGPEGAGALAPVEDALNRLTGAIEEHKTKYDEFKRATREPDQEGPARRNPRIKALAKALDEATQKCKDLSNEFNLAFRKASGVAQEARARFKLAQAAGDVFAANAPPPGGAPPPAAVPDPAPAPPDPPDADPPPQGRRPLIPLEPIRDTSRDPPRPLQGRVEERAPAPPDPPDADPPPQGRRPLIPLEPIRDTSRDPPRPLQGRVEERAPAPPDPPDADPPPQGRRPLIPLEPIRDTSRDPLRGRVEKTQPPQDPQKHEPPGKEDPEKPEQKDEGPDPARKTQPAPPGGKGPPTLQGTAQDQDDNPLRPKIGVERTHRTVPDDPKKNKKKTEFKISLEVPENRRLRGRTFKDGNNEVTVGYGTARAELKASDEGVELNGEVEVTGVKQKAVLYKSRDTEVNLEADYLTAKGGASATFKKGARGLEAKAAVGGEAKLFDVKGSAKQRVVIGDYAVNFELEGSAGVGAGGTIEGELDTSRGFKYKGREGFGFGFLQSVQFSFDVEPVKK